MATSIEKVVDHLERTTENMNRFALILERVSTTLDNTVKIISERHAEYKIDSRDMWSKINEYSKTHDEKLIIFEEKIHSLSIRIYVGIGGGSVVGLAVGWILEWGMGWGQGGHHG